LYCIVYANATSFVSACSEWGLKKSKHLGIPPAAVANVMRHQIYQVPLKMQAVDAVGEESWVINPTGTTGFLSHSILMRSRPAGL